VRALAQSPRIALLATLLLSASCGTDRIAHTPVAADGGVDQSRPDSHAGDSRTDLRPDGLSAPDLRPDLLQPDAPGGAWIAEASQTAQHIHGVFVLDSNTAWAVGDGGTILRRGATGWSAENSTVGDDLRGVWARSATDVWAAGGSPIVRFDGGAWKSSSAAVKGKLTGLSGVPVGAASSLLWAVGDDGAILEGGSGGGFQLLQILGAPLRAVYARSSTEVWVAGDGGAVWRGGSGGASAWSSEKTPTTQDLHGLCEGPAGQLWAVGDGGTILRRQASGSWVAEPSSVTTPLRAIWGPKQGDGTLWAVGDDGVVLRRESSGSWISEPSAVSVDLLGVHGAADATTIRLWATGRGGTILRSERAGP
jgi:hypothetical protein